MNTSYIKGLKTPIAIIGLGKSGQAALRLLKACGIDDKQIITFDEKDSSANFTNSVDLLKTQPKTLVVSPGVPLKTTWIQSLIDTGSHLTSEITLAASLITTEKIIGITGSVGKSTVTSLLGVGASSTKKPVFVGGNLGTPFCEYALSLFSGAPKASWIILELSSFHLENCDQLLLDYSIITFLSANHLERYENIEDYYKTKFKITALTKNICLLNASSDDCKKYSSMAACKYDLINSENFSFKEFLNSVFLLGKHNKDNFSLAAEMAKICGWPAGSILAMCDYRGLPHRLEYVVELKGITYVNDSKATALDSVLVAVDACIEKASSKENKLFLLLGGKDKNLPWNQLSILKSNPKIIPVFFGACGTHAKNLTQLNGEYFEKLGSAINYCQKRALAGDTILLSPGGTSLDEFKNFEERGDFFKSLVLSDFEA